MLSTFICTKLNQIQTRLKTFCTSRKKKHSLVPPKQAQCNKRQENGPVGKNQTACAVISLWLVGMRRKYKNYGKTDRLFLHLVVCCAHYFFQLFTRSLANGAAPLFAVFGLCLSARFSCLAVVAAQLSTFKFTICFVMVICLVMCTLSVDWKPWIGMRCQWNDKWKFGPRKDCGFNSQLPGPCCPPVSFSLDSTAGSYATQRVLDKQW